MGGGQIMTRVPLMSNIERCQRSELVLFVKSRLAARNLATEELQGDSLGDASAESSSSLCRVSKP